jgi:hypothetical protein
MIKIIPVILSLSLCIVKSYSQDSVYICKNAIKFDRQDSLNDDIYRSIKNYKLIMIGELHGTCEPANFVIGLVELLTKKGNNVQVGLEIPSNQMEKYNSLPNDSNIYLSEFFTKKSIDGKATYAWANIIGKLNDNKKIEIFFYDNLNGDFNTRDSLMYLNIKKRIQLHPNWKTVTVIGNMHNMLIPYKGKPKTAYFLSKDKDLNISNKILSIQHLYSKGTMLNSSGPKPTMYSCRTGFLVCAKR